MIPRILVPRDVRPAAEKPDGVPPRRLTTLLDDRTLVAANLPRAELQTHSLIPAHLPLGVLASRVVVPRDTPATPLAPEVLHPEYAPVTVLDQRVTVPMALPVVELKTEAAVSPYEFPDVLEPDVLNTGNVNLMVAPVETPPRDWNWLARSCSIAFHIAFISFLLLQSKIFPYRPPTQSQIDLARQQLNFIYMPPDVRGLPPTPRPRQPAVRVDPRILRQITPPMARMPQPMPTPRAPQQELRATPSPEPPPDLPAAPKPQVQQQQAQQDTSVDAPKPQLQAQNHLILPRALSPRRMLDQSVEQSREGSGGAMQGFGGRLPGAAAPGYGGGGGGGGGQGYGAVQMLTPTEGVDFSGYLARVVESVRRNWYAVMPESAYLGDRGKVVLRFRITSNGAVPDGEPQQESSSGKEPLDRAAYSSIRASSPFEPLPPAFSGPYIELRFIFLYNLPLSEAQ
jgi:TonB family protein